MIICALTAVPLGVATAILLEEYQPRNKWVKMIHNFVQNNITNLAGVPSIVYGILGFTVFAIAFDLANPEQPLFDFGYETFHEYSSAGDKNYYVPADSNDPLKPAVKGMKTSFYASINDAREGADAAIVEIADEGRTAGIKKSVDQRMRAINSTMKSALRKATANGEVQIDEAKAQTVADAMLTPFKDDLRADYGKMVSLAADELVKMNGLGAVELIIPRRNLRSKILQAEYNAAGLQTIIVTNSMPRNKKVPHWYYFQIPFGKSVLAGGLTLMLVILPVIIVSSQEAIRAVSREMRSGVLALGGTKWQAIEKVVLPSAVPGICTGTILALSRAIGEAAPILLIGFTTLQVAPDNLMAKFAAMPLQIYFWTAEPEAAFRFTAASAIIILLVVLLSFNAVAVYIRQKATQAN